MGASSMGATSSVVPLVVKLPELFFDWKHLHSVTRATAVRRYKVFLCRSSVHESVCLGSRLDSPFCPVSPSNLAHKARVIRSLESGRSFFHDWRRNAEVSIDEERIQVSDEPTIQVPSMPNEALTRKSMPNEVPYSLHEYPVNSLSILCQRSGAA